MRGLFEDADERITDWMLTNTGVVISLLICFAAVVLVSALVS